MDVRWKMLLVGVAATGPLVGALAPPASADTVATTVDVHFTSGGAETTCTVQVISSLHYNADADRTDLEMYTQLADDDAVCAQAIEVVEARATYQRAKDGPVERLSTRSFSGNTSSSWTVSGPVVSFSVEHDGVFACDSSASGCSFDVTTSPK